MAGQRWIIPIATDTWIETDLARRAWQHARHLARERRRMGWGNTATMTQVFTGDTDPQAVKQFTYTVEA